MARGKDALEKYRFLRSRKETLFLESAGSFEREVTLTDGAEVEIAFLNCAPDGEAAACRTSVLLGKNASLKLLNCNFGGSETRSEIAIEQKEGSRCEHFEIALLSGSQRLVSRVSHIHGAPKTFSRSSFRYAAADSSRIDMEGNVTLGKKAAGGDAHLVAKSLLLSPNASVKVVPMLYVWNSDVAAGHGAAMAPFSEEELFYMNARGIDSPAGKRMILAGFLSEPAAKVDAALLGKATKALERKMGEIHGI
jgi:Fe-S cluster assembly protein SufD